MSNTKNFIPVDALAAGFAGENNTRAQVQDLAGQEITVHLKGRPTRSFAIDGESFIRWASGHKGREQDRHWNGNGLRTRAGD